MPAIRYAVPARLKGKRLRGLRWSRQLRHSRLETAQYVRTASGGVVGIRSVRCVVRRCGQARPIRRAAMRRLMVSA
jgi:hypothetical protein